MPDALEDLLRASTLDYGHIQLFRDEEGWQADICHYRRDPRDTRGGQVFIDPVDALRTVLAEDERVGRDVARRYAAAAKAGPVEQYVDPDGACMLCEGGGCDLCRPPVDDAMAEFGL